MKSLYNIKNIKRNMPRRKNLNKILAQRQSSHQHLKSLKIEEFIKFCHHQQIATIFGNSRVCKRPAPLCSQCQKHKRDDYKHEYLDAKQFIGIVKRTKQKYREYHNLFINKVIPEFFQLIKICILQYMEGVGSWGDQTLMTNNFFYCTKNKKILSLFNEDIQSWDMSDFTCRDIAELLYVNQKIENISEKQIQADILQDLKQLFKKSLVAYELIAEQKNSRKQQEINIQANIQETTSKLNQMLKTIDRAKSIEEISKCKLSIKINDILLNQINQYEDALRRGDQIKIKTKQEAQINQKQEQVNTKLKKMIDTMEDYFSRCHNPSIKINVKVNLQKTEFWHYFFDKILNILDEVGGRIEEFIIINENNLQLAKMFYQYVQNQEKDLYNDIKAIANQQTKDINVQKDKKITSDSKNMQNSVEYCVKNVKIIFRSVSK